MNTPQAIQDVYDFENIIPNAVAIAPSLAALNPATQSTLATLQKPRPRTELVFKVNGEAVPRRMIGNLMYNAAFRGTLGCTVITDTDAIGKQVNAQYISQLRWLMPQIGTSVNGIILLKHRIQFVRDAGATLLRKSEDGYWQASVQFDVDFTIQADALIALNN